MLRVIATKSSGAKDIYGPYIKVHIDAFSIRGEELLFYTEIAYMTYMEIWMATKDDKTPYINIYVEEYNEVSD